MAVPQSEVRTERECTDLVLQAAYLPSTVSAKAAATGLSRKQVRRASKATMWASLQQQNEFLQKVAESDAKIKVCWERIEFDETKQRLQVRSHKELGGMC